MKVYFRKCPTSPDRNYILCIMIKYKETRNGESQQIQETDAFIFLYRSEAVSYSWHVQASLIGVYPDRI